MRVDWLIVGAGYTGCVFAERIASQLDKKVLLIDVRNHIGGNAYDFFDDNGILIHKYGPHIFHTNSKKVWNYLSHFTDWIPYEHRVLAEVDGKKIPVPFNLNSLHKIFPKTLSSNLERLLLEKYGPEGKIPILKLLENPNKEIKKLARYVYDKIFYGYTVKQWELKPEELDPSVTGRIPVYLGRDDRYFQDIYQAMPKDGYTKLFEAMIRHPNINLLLENDYRQLVSDIHFKKMIYTGPIDSFFDYLYGELPYRSLRFEFINQEKENFQEVAQINYPNEHLYTRISEFKHMTGQRASNTTFAKEYPQPYEKGKNVPYYPIPQLENREKYNLYLKETKKLKDSVKFAGRLADYKYYNMDQAVGRALNFFEREISLIN